MLANFPERLSIPRLYASLSQLGNKNTELTSSVEFENLSELNNGHEEIQQKLLELKELSLRRDSELKSIQETIKECKSKVASLTANNDQRNWHEKLGMSDGIFNKQKLKHPGTLKLFGGVIILFYLLTLNVRSRLIPNLPTIYGFLHVVTVIYNFAHKTGKSTHTFLLQLGGVQDQPVNTILEDHAFGALLSTLSIMFLKLKRCSPDASCATCLQMAFSTVSYMMDMHDICYFDFVDETSSNGSRAQTCTKALSYVQLLSIATYFFIK